MEALVYTFLLVSTLGTFLLVSTLGIIFSLSFFENRIRFRLKNDF